MALLWWWTSNCQLTVVETIVWYLLFAQQTVISSPASHRSTHALTDIELNSNKFWVNTVNHLIFWPKNSLTNAYICMIRTSLQNNLDSRQNTEFQNEIIGSLGMINDLFIQRFVW